MNSIISLGLFKESGGPTKTISYFQKALSAEVYAFCKVEEVVNSPLALENSFPVLSYRMPLLSHFCVPPATDCKQAELALAKSNVISVHSFYRYHNIWVNKMSKRYHVPYWFVPHGILDPWVMEKGSTVKKLYWKMGGKRFVDQSSTVIFSTTAERDKALYQFDLPSTEVIPWPVKLVDISRRNERRRILRETLGIPESAKVLLYFGRLHSMKRPLETIAAFATGGGDNLHLLIVGNEQDVTLKDCFLTAEKYNVDKRVHLIGPIYGEKKYDYLMASDAYISLSYRENFNHTAAESLSVGLPLILSPGNDLQGDIYSARCSWNLNDNEIKSASNVIEEFTNLDHTVLSHMGMRGRQWVELNLKFKTFQERLQLLATKYGKC